MNRTIKFIPVTMLLLILVSGAVAQGPSDTEFEIYDDNPVIPVGEPGEWDDTSNRFPFVVLHDGLYHMFYTSFRSANEPMAIGYAMSEDGMNWVKYENNPVFTGSGIDGSFDEFGVNAAAVMVEEDGTWVMYYNGNSEPGLPPFGKSIGRATASGPTGPWTRDDEPVLSAGSLRRWDGSFIFPSSIVKTEDGLYHLYYSANGTGKGMLGLATSEDGINFTKYDDPSTTDIPLDESDPVLPTGQFDERDAPVWDDSVSWGGAVRLTENGWEMFYTGGTSTYDVGFAYSADGIQWTRYGEGPVIDIQRGNTLFGSAVWHDDGTIFVYFGWARGTPTDPSMAIGTVTYSE